MIEALADVNEDIMEKYLDGQEISNDEIRAAIRQATLNLDVYPVFAGSAFKNKGLTTTYHHQLMLSHTRQLTLTLTKRLT